MSAPDVDELYSTWISFRSSLLRLEPTAERVRLDGAEIVFTDLSWALMNAGYFTRPAVDEADAARRLDGLKAYFQRRQRKWTLTFRDEWLTPEVQSAIDTRGFLRVGGGTRAMSAERLLPGRPPPSRLEIRRVTDEAGRLAFLDINARCYTAPAGWAAEMARHEALFTAEDFVHAGYVDGQPAAVSATLKLGDVLYVAWVATRPELRGRGYAEAVMRHSYEEARRAHGLQRTALHSSDAGFRMYEAMGYRVVGRTSMFSEP